MGGQRITLDDRRSPRILRSRPRNGRLLFAASLTAIDKTSLCASERRSNAGQKPARRHCLVSRPANNFTILLGLFAAFALKNLDSDPTSLRKLFAGRHTRR